MVKTYICLFSIVFTLSAASQPDDQILIDSIESNSPENLDSLYYNLFIKNRVKNPSLAEDYALLSYEYAKPSNDHNYMIRSLNALGYLSKQKQNIEKAAEYYTEAIKIASANNIEERLVFLYNNLGNIYTSTSQFDMAIDNYLKSLQFARRVENINEQAIALNNIGLINYKLGNFEEAIAYYLDALEIRKANDLYEDINTTYINLALCYNAIGSRQEAINAFNSVLNNVSDSDKSITIDAYFGLGKTHFDQNRNMEAERFFKLAYDLAESNGETKKLSSIEYYLAYIYFRNNNVSKALLFLNRSQEKAKKINSWERLKNNYELFSNIYENNSDYLHAYSNLKQFVAYKDSIFNEQLAEKFKDAFVSYQESISDEIIEGQQQSIKKSRQYAFLLGLSLVFATVVVILLYRNNQYRRRMNEKLDGLVKDRTNELINTNEKLVKSRKELNNFLYKTSHDIRGPIATLMGLTNLTRLEYPNENIDFFLRKIDSTAEHLNEIINRLTIISHISTQPVTIEKINLYELIHKIIKECESQYSRKIQFKIKGNPPDFIHSDKVLMEYILQSLLNNSYKYSKDEEANPYIELKVTAEPELSITITDNGIGIQKKYADKIFDLFFVANETDHGAGIGLYQAMLAVERLQGSISLKRLSKPTVFKVSLNGIHQNTRELDKVNG
jgi:signal transduction histidine kinase/Flp pilus assembly protein TadD